MYPISKSWTTIRFGISKWVMATINYDNPMGWSAQDLGHDHAWISGISWISWIQPVKIFPSCASKANMVQERNASGFVWFHHVLHWLEVCLRCSVFERDFEINLSNLRIMSSKVCGKRHWHSAGAVLNLFRLTWTRDPTWGKSAGLGNSLNRIPGWSHPSRSCLWLPTERDMQQKNRARWAWKAERGQMYTK